MVTNYERGRWFEYKVKKLLEKRGWVVVRSAGSKKIDLVAMKDGKIVFIECKRDGRVKASQTLRQHRLARKAGAKYVIVTPRNLKKVLRSL